jgi:hypothetical protein
VADELLGYTPKRQGTTVNCKPEVRAKNAVDGRVIMTFPSAHAQYRLAIEPEI